MNKQEFLSELRKKLTGIPESEKEERLIFYGEMIDDRMEEGLSEAEAVAAIGTADGIASQILSETCPAAKEEAPKKASRPPLWKTLLLILGFPVWLPLLLAGFAILFALCVVLWALAFCLWAVEVSLLLCALGGVAAAVFFLLRGHGLSGLVLFAFGLVAAGLSLLFLPVCRGGSRGILWLTKKGASGIKILFCGKEGAK